MTKGKILAVLNNTGNEVDLDEFTKRLYTLEKIEKGRREIDEGKGIPHEEAKRRLAKWLA